MYGNSPLYKSCPKNTNPRSLLLYMILTLHLALLTQHVFMIKIQIQLHKLLNNFNPTCVTDLNRDVNSINITLGYP